MTVELKGPGKLSVAELLQRFSGAVNAGPSASEIAKIKEDLAKRFKKVDPSIWGFDLFDQTLSAALSCGEVGIFLLDCLVAEPKMADGALGKTLITDAQTVLVKSGILYQVEPIKFLLAKLAKHGLKISLFTFLGDDDFVYSVSAPFALQHASVQDAVNWQIATIGHQFKQTLGQMPNVDVQFLSWFQAEQHYLPGVRNGFSAKMKQAVVDGSLPAPVIKRLTDFIGWRQQTVSSAGLNTTAYVDVIAAQAVEELTCFAFQGGFAPAVIQELSPNLPLIFFNHYPDPVVHPLDDVCVRLAGQWGYPTVDYSTVHLYGPEVLAQTLQPKNHGKNTKGHVMERGCY